MRLKRRENRSRQKRRLLNGVGAILSRIRYFRGHGIHSPYIYKIVRNVFMQRDITAPNRELYEKLANLDMLSTRYTTELQNLYTYLDLTSFVIDSPICAEMTIYTPSYPLDKVLNSYTCGTIVVILQPHLTHQREIWCNEIVTHHNSTTLHRAEYLLIFNNHLPKQHFQL